MALPDVVSRADWLEARKALLVKEKEITRARDALNAERRRLPMVRMDKAYAFEGPDGTMTLADLFEGRRQLMVYHFMFDPAWDGPCPSCSGFVDEIARGHLTSLKLSNTTFAAISLAPYAKIEPFKARMGWTFPWYSSSGTEFNHDFHVTLDESVTPLEYNYRTKDEWSRTSFRLDEWEQPFELHGMSCFLQDGGEVFHTYSTYGRGAEAVGGSAYFLDLTALGRQQDWEEPKGRAESLGLEAGGEALRYPDEYDV